MDPPIKPADDDDDRKATWAKIIMEAADEVDATYASGGSASATRHGSMLRRFAAMTPEQREADINAQKQLEKDLSALFSGSEKN